MRTRERVIVYGTLVLLVCFNLTAFFGGGLGDPAISGSAAVAAPTGSTGDDTGVDSLTLTATGDAPDVILRNHAGRLAWGKSAHDRAYSVAYVYIGAVLKQLMQSEEMQEDRERLLGDLNDKDADFRQRLQDLGERLQGLDASGDEWKRVRKEGEDVYEQYMGWQQEAMTERGKLDAAHLERAYREMIEAVQVVGDRMDIDTIYRFIPTDEPFEADNPEQAMVSIRLRTALRYPDDLDVTDQVLEELSLEIE